MKRYYKKNRKSLLVFAVSNILAAISSVFLSFLLGVFADIAMTGDFKNLWIPAICTFFYIFIETFLNFSLQYTRDVAIHKIGKDLRSDVIRKIENLPFEVKQKNDDGYYLSIINNDISTVEQEYLDSLGAIYFQICCFIIAIIASFIIQPVMTIIMVLVSILPVVFPKLTKKSLQESKVKVQQAKASYMSSITQIFNGFFLLKVFDGFKGINKLNDSENNTLYDKIIKFSRMRSALYAGTYGCGNLVFLGTWVLGLFFVTNKFISLPLLITFSQLMTFVAGPIQIISERYSSTIAASAVCKQIISFLDDPLNEELSWGETVLNEITEVKLSNICYNVNEKTLLRNVDLVLHKGDRVALIGESGSGKSTLLKILAAIYKSQGTYIINGKPYNSYNYQDFRACVTILEQKSFVFNSSIRDNISLFSKTSNDDSFLKVINEAGINKWYKGRGESLDLLIGSDNKGLSGGEERRLDLARTLYRHAKFVMLDEPTTGLDMKNRKFIENTIEQIDCDILVVAMHDYSSQYLSSFNKIITMKDGKLKES